MNCFSRYKLIVFDLDNTLIVEKEYLFEAYEDIACFLEKKYSVDKEKVGKYLKNEFTINGRFKLFDKMVDHFEISEVKMDSILNILRTVKPRRKIRLVENMKLVLKMLVTNRIPYVILTNGNVRQQKNKVANIQWEGLQKDIIYASEIKPKPEIISFSTYLSKNRIKINQSKILMVGDSDEDRLFAQNFGCDFKHISTVNCNNTFLKS